MSEIETINVQRRDAVGKGAARAARRAGMIPGIVYGLDQAPVAIALGERELNRLRMRGAAFFSHLYRLAFDGQAMSVLARDVQVHPVTDRPMHVDFLRVDVNEAITVEVPVVFINEEACPGLREGGILNVVRHEVEVECRPDAIPEQIEIDLAQAQIGDSLHISSVKLPDGVKPTITDRDFTIATIAAPSVMPDVADGDAEPVEADEDGQKDD